MQINNHGTINQFKDDFNKPNTIFLAHSKRMHWVCFSNVYHIVFIFTISKN